MVDELYFLREKRFRKTVDISKKKEYTFQRVSYN